MKLLKFNKKEEVKKYSTSWLTPQLANLIKDLFRTPVYIERTKMKFDKEDLAWLIDKGYIEFGEKGELKIINKKKVINLAKGKYKITEE